MYHTFAGEDMMGVLKGEVGKKQTLNFYKHVKPPWGTSGAGWTKRADSKRGGREQGILRFARLQFKTLLWKIPVLLPTNREYRDA